MSNPNLFFSTPVWVSEIDNYKDTNEKIYHYIKNLQGEDNKGIIRSNVKGWHSNNFNLENENVIEFINLISPNINSVLNDMNWDISKQRTKISAMWAIINIGGASNSRHHHGNSDKWNGSFRTLLLHAQGTRNYGESSPRLRKRRTGRSYLSAVRTRIL